MNNAATALDPRLFGVASVAGRRPVNEDAWAGPPPGAYDASACFVVADGVGGQERGDLASRTAVAAVGRVFYERRAAGDTPPAALLAAVAAANSEVYRLAQSLGVERMGCTMVVAAVGGGRLDVAHVGDARAWLLQGGRLYALTRDHTWVQEQIDRGTITPADAAQHELRHIVTRVLGNEATIEATLARPAAFGSGDRLLLSSDGLHDVVDEARLAHLLGATAPATAAQALVEAALAGGSEDNVTALVVEGAEVTPVARPPAVERRPPAEVSPAAPPPERRSAGVPPAAESAAEVTTVQGKRPPAGYRPPEGRGAVAARPAQPRRRAAVLPALGAAVLVLLFFVWLVSTLSRGSGGSDALPTVAIPAGSATVTPGSAATSPAAAATSTDGPTGNPGPTATAASVHGTMVCLDSTKDVYLWVEELAGDGSLCDQTTGEPKLQDERVELLSSLTEPESLLTDTRDGCIGLPFVRVRTSKGEGWILRETVLEECPEEQ